MDKYFDGQMGNQYHLGRVNGVLIFPGLYEDGYSRCVSVIHLPGRLPTVTVYETQVSPFRDFPRY